MYTVYNLTNSSIASRMSQMTSVRGANILGPILRLFTATSITTPLTQINFLDITSVVSRGIVFLTDTITEGTAKSSLPEIKSLYRSFRLF